MFNSVHLSYAVVFTTAFVMGGALFSGLAVYAANTWSGPSSAPPDGNVAAPINVSSSSQVKEGGLWLGSLGVTGYARSDTGFCISDDCITSWAAGLGGSSTEVYVNGSQVTNALIQADFTLNTGSLNQYITFPKAYKSGTVPVVVLNRNYTPGGDDTDNYACDITNESFKVCGDSREWSGNGRGHPWIAIGVAPDS